MLIFFQNLTADYSLESHSLDLDRYVSVVQRRRRRAKALVDFERHDHDELGFKKNDVINVSLMSHKHRSDILAFSCTRNDQNLVKGVALF